MASASLTIGGLQTALATNALGIQLGTGLLAALALGRVLLQVGGCYGAKALPTAVRGVPACTFHVTGMADDEKDCMNG